MISIVISGLAMVSCEKPNVFEDEELINSLYQKAQDTLTYNGSKYILETYLYRDFMPGGPISEERPLISILYLVNSDSLIVSKNLKLDKLYVIKEDLVYKDNPEFQVDNSIPQYKQSYICREGPEWETEIIVDVVIKLVEKNTNENYFLISRNQPIEKVW